MPYEIRERNGKFYVVDTDNNDKIRGTYDNEDLAEDRKDELDFRAHVRSRIDRLPVTQMTAEEKAAAYDKMMEEKEKEDKNIPPKKEDKPPRENKKERRGYWADWENE